MKNEWFVNALGKKQIQLTPQFETTCCFYEIQTTHHQNWPVHHVLLLDGSGSLLKELENIKELVSETIKTLSVYQTQYLSILLFAGQSDYEWLIKGGRCCDIMNEIESLHRRLEEVAGSTDSMLSHAFEESFNFIVSLDAKEEKYHFIVVTDGHVQTPEWGVAVEEHRCLVWALECLAKQIRLNVIGIGQYRLDFLSQLAKVGGSGDFYYYDSAKQYRKLLKHQVKQLIKQSGLTLKLMNTDYFIMQQSLHVHYKKLLTTAGKLPQLIVTFNQPLMINETCFQTSELTVSSEVEQQFTQAYASYLLKQKEVDAATFLLQNYNFKAAKIVNQSYSSQEIGQCLANLNQQKLTDKLDSFSVLELLQQILDDPCSQLWWYDETFSQPLLKHQEISFEAICDSLLKVQQVRVSSTNLNITFTIKIPGHAKDERTQLKLASYLFRECLFLSNGHLTTQVLACQLSPNLKRRLQQLHLISREPIDKQRQIYLIELSRLKLMNRQFIQEVTDASIIQQLLEIEHLKLSIDVLKRLSQQYRQYPSQQNQTQLRKKYHLHSSGMFEGVRTKEIKDQCLHDIVEWKVENVSKREAERKIYEQLMQTFLNQNLVIDWDKELMTLKQKRLKCKNRVNLQRIQFVLCKQSPFDWDEVFEKQTKRTDIKDQTIFISKQKKDEIIICENKYTQMTTIY